MFSDSRVVKQSRRFVNVQLPSGPLAKQFKVSGYPTMVFLSSRGEELGRMSGAPAPEALAQRLSALAEKAEEPAWEAFDKAVASKKVTPLVASIQRISVITTPRAKEKLVEFVKDEEAAEPVRRAAIEGLGRQGEGSAELVIILTHKSGSLKSAANRALRAQGAAAVDALLEGLDADDAERRAACHGVLSVVTRFSKEKNAQFWRTASASERKAALDDWRQWWDQNKPKDLAQREKE